MMPEMEMVKDAALKYDKPTLARMAQMGQLSPTIAVMAGMMRDRIVQSEMKPPEQTVAEEVMQPMGQQMGLAAAQQMQGQPPAQGQGLDQIPVSDQMFNAPQGMAGGGIVAFQAGGFNPAQRGMFSSTFGPSSNMLSREDIVGMLTLPELQLFNRTGELPERFRSIVGDKAIGFAPATERAVQPTAAQLSALEARASETAIQPTDAQLSALEARAVGPIPPPPPPGLGPQPGSTADMGAVSGLREELMGRIKEAYPDLTSGVKPKESTVGDILKEREEAETAAGVDKRFFENEAKRIVALSDKLKGDKNEAANMRLIEAGLRIMGGESPYAFVNIGKGASEALKGFSDDIKDIQKTKREYDKAERELRTAEQLYARNKSDEALKEVQRRRERAEERNTSFQKAMMDMEVKLADFGIRREALGIQRQQVAQGASSPIERIAERLRKENPNLNYEQSVQKAYGMQQEPKTRAALEKEFLENPILVNKYGTFDNYLRSQSGAGTNYRERYGLE